MTIWTILLDLLIFYQFNNSITFSRIELQICMHGSKNIETAQLNRKESSHLALDETS